MGLFIPPEIHHTIVRFLDDEDLCSMRLVSKMLADIAAKQLFRVIKVHASLESFLKVLNISKHAALAKQTQTMIWDSNLWDLRDIDTFEDFAEYVSWRPFHPSDIEKTQDEIFRIHYEKYKNRVEEEWVLLQDFEPLTVGTSRFDSAARGGLRYISLSRILPIFSNLKKISVCNGKFTCENGKAKKEWRDCGPPKDDEIISRGEKLHILPAEDVGTGVHEFWTSLLAAPPTITKFRADAVHHTAFFPEHIAMPDQYEKMIVESLLNPLNDDNRKFQHPCQNLTSLHLTITTLQGIEEDIAPQPGNEEFFLKRFHALLRGFTKLQSLHLSLERRLQWSGSISAPLIIPDGIVPRCTWPYLRKLSLAYVDMSPDQLKSLIIDHSATLEELRLCDICLDTNLRMYVTEDVDVDLEEDPGDWIGLILMLREHLHLKRARFEGCLWSDPEFLIDDPPRWRMSDNGLGVALAKFLVNGGEMPMTKSNICEYTDSDDEDSDEMYGEGEDEDEDMWEDDDLDSEIMEYLEMNSP